MTIGPIPIIRAAYLNLFIDVLGTKNSHNEILLQQFNLPGTLYEKPDAYIPLKSALLFIRWGIYNHDIEDIGLHVGSRLRISDFDSNLYNALLDTSSLKEALQTFCKFAETETSPVSYSIAFKQDEVHISSSYDTQCSTETDYYFEWLQIMSLLAIIRYFTDDHWTPSAISFRSRLKPGKLAHKLFSDTRLQSGQTKTVIILPASLLKLKSKKDCQPSQYTQPSVSLDFPSSLQKILQSYLHTGYPDIKLAAEISSISVRTLQRRLKYFSISYTNLVQQARFEMATNILKEPDIKVIDAAYAAGYDDPSHFTRAFKRVLGISPLQYRARNCLST